MRISLIFGCLGAMSVGGCASLPSSGPTTSEVVSQAVAEGKSRFDLVEVDYHALAAQAARPEPTFKSSFGNDGKPPAGTIGVGDAVTVSISQLSGAGLLGGQAAGVASSAVPLESGGAGSLISNIPEQVVSADGAISVPYAGRVHVADRTPYQVQETIEHLLANREIEPQVIVTVSKSVSSMVTVSGEGVGGARVALSIRGDHLLDVIAAAGGVRAAVYETLVQLSRGGKTVSVPMDRLVSDPSENIYVWPGDLVTLIRSPQTFSVFGAAQTNVQMPFNADRLSLAQAIAKAGGLQDARADPAGVFLLRFEPQSIVEALGAPPLQSAISGRSPVLYHLTLQDVSGYFLASKFPIQDEDIIYVANASSDKLQKFFTLISTITGPVISGAVVTHGN